MYKKLGKSDEIGYYPERWFKAIAKACDTAAPIAMNDVEKCFLVQFLETTMDRLRNPDNNPGELEIRIVLPSTGGAYKDPDSNKSVDEESVLSIMYQLFETFHKDLRLNFEIVGVYEKSDDWAAQDWRKSVREYGEGMDPDYGIVDEEDVDAFKLRQKHITPRVLKSMGIA